MSVYEKQAANFLTKAEALENLTAVLSARYFQPCTFNPRYSKISSDLIQITDVGGFVNPLTGQEDARVKDIGSIIITAAKSIVKKGNLHSVRLGLRFTSAMLQKYDFSPDFLSSVDKPRCRLSTTLHFEINLENESNKYRFRLLNYNVDEDFYHVRDVPRNRTQQELWRADVTKQLAKILPTPVQDIKRD